MPNFDGFLAAIRLAFQLPDAEGFKLGFAWIIIFITTFFGTLGWIFRKLRIKK